MPKSRSNEPRQPSSGSFVGLAIIAGMLMLLAGLFVHGNLTGGRDLQARAYDPPAKSPAAK
ncbi:hypothetical protein ASE04_12300 [Rhizobium sp. Root708]|uniref:hypothetical protein n=1 Tax=Rhizobium sp. Root708 TaxID=1736592 RepID=UPI0007005BD0|nr:hypothetical protein [Rhizobium sp. Root708]KRB50707.1 hypothetical protein ASE04_12300 [Rhizobium sp. Root708]